MSKQQKFSEAQLRAILAQPGYGVIQGEIAPGTARKESPSAANRALRKAKREQLQYSFLVYLMRCGGDRNAWQSEYTLTVADPTINPEGRRYRFDWVHHAARVLVEVNGGQWSKRSGHNSGKGLHRDADKTAVATAAGWTVFSLTTDMLSETTYEPYINRIVQATKARKA